MLKTLKLLFVFTFTIVGAIVGKQLGEWYIDYPSVKQAIGTENKVLLIGVLLAWSALTGLLFWMISGHMVRFITRMGMGLEQLPTADKLALIIGVIIGLVLTALVYLFLSNITLGPVLIFAVGVALIYISVNTILSMKDDLFFNSWSGAPNREEVHLQKCKLLDTNVIIDGRIADVCQTGFVEGPIYVPGFVLEELQHIADSSDSLKRNRGRRGLDILNQMQKELKLEIRPSPKVNPDDPQEVDARLVFMAKDLDGVIITNDYNLNKVAELQGVPVLNVNELANALKPVVLPGEEMAVSILKEGKEMNQGIAYLEDGTMVVVESAKRHIGETIDVVVTSVLQTVAGKMIFANIKAYQEEEDDIIDRNIRTYSSSRARKKIR
ncbi:MAG: TRAM domain-containing protein [Armatimonadetes bacterium]|nr:TRAM domain-containing protein [Armatimonadota bacterium]